MTDYTYRVTIIVPEANMADANQLALVVGESVNDDRTFLSADWRDASDNAYALASTVATQNLLTKIAGQLEENPFEADLDAANRAKDLLSICTTVETVNSTFGYPLTTEENPVTVSSSAILCVVGMNGESAINHANLAGVTRIEANL